MKTLFISYNGALEPLIQSQALPYLEGIARCGFSPILLTFEKPADLKGPDSRQLIKSLKERLRTNRIAWYFLTYHKRPTVPATILDIALGIIVSIYLTVRYRVRLIHCRATVPAVIGFIASRLSGARLLYDVRGLMAEEYADGGMWKRGGALYRLTRLIEKRLFLSADARIVLTENIAAFLKTSDYLPAAPASINRESIVIPCCVDLERFSPHIGTAPQEDTRFVLLYSGSLGTWYLLEEMLDFYQELCNHLPEARFLLATHTSAAAVRLRQQARGIPESRLSVISASFEQMPGILAQADAGIFFIKPVFSKRSSCPIKFAEYLACGKPVIINAGIGDTDAIVAQTRTGVVIKSFERREYSDKIEELRNLIREDAAGLTQRCRRAAREHFDLEDGIRRYVTVYRSVCPDNTSLEDTQ